MFRVMVGLIAAALLLTWTHGVAAASAPPLEAYGRLPDIEDVSLSPSGKRVALVKVVGEERRLLVLEPGGRVLVNAPVGDVKLSRLDWAGDGYLLVTRRQTVAGGIDFGWNSFDLKSVLVVDVEAMRQFWVFESGQTVGAVFGAYGVRHVEGGWRGYFAGSEDVFLPISLYEVDFATGKSRRVMLGTERRRDSWLVAPDGEVLARSSYLESSGDWALFRGRSRDRLMSRRSTHRSTVLAGFARTRDTALIFENADEGAVALEVPVGRDGETVRLGSGIDIAGFVRDSSGALIGFHGWDRQLHFLDPKAQARWRGTLKAFAGYTVSLVGYTDDLSVMVVFTDGGDDSGTYWLVDIGTGDARPLGRAYASVGADHVARTRTVTYRASDGLPMDGVLTLPPGREAKDLPVIVLPHGGPVVAGDVPGFDWQAQAYASRGYAVFQPNYRGTRGYGDSFVRAAYGEWGGKMQTDISDGIAELARQGIVDPARACIVGSSYGGYAALAGVTLQQGLYRCAVSVNGVADLESMLAEVRDRRGWHSDSMRFWRKLMGAETRDLAAISPARQASRADAPILLIHGREDTVVLFEQSKRMERELKRAGKPVELVALDGEDHYLSRSDTRLAALRAAVAFIERHNPPD